MEEFRFWNKYSKEEAEGFYKNANITLDSNVLIELYRTSPAISNLFFEILEQIQERVFITNHAMLEFHKNRFGTIKNNYSQLSSLRKDIISFKTNIVKDNFFHYISPQTKIDLDQEIEDKLQRLTEREEYFKSIEINDTIYKKISKLLGDKVLESFSIKEKEEVSKEGEKRFKSKVPPGYMDKDKQTNKFGDLIIWKEIIEEAKKQKKNILLISNEKKEDWLWVLNDKSIVGARPELKIEMNSLANVDFQISSLKSFIFALSDDLNIKIDKTALSSEFKFESLLDGNFMHSEIIRKQKEKEEKRIKEVNTELEKINNLILEYESKERISDDEQSSLNNLKQRKIFLESSLTSVLSSGSNK